MKKLSSSFGTKLSAAQLKNIKGREGSPDSTLVDSSSGGNNVLCWITTYDQYGATVETFGFPNNRQAWANQYCSNVVVTAGSGVYRCRIRCSV